MPTNTSGVADLASLLARLEAKINSLENEVAQSKSATPPLPPPPPTFAAPSAPVHAFHFAPPSAAAAGEEQTVGVVALSLAVAAAGLFLCVVAIGALIFRRRIWVACAESPCCEGLLPKPPASSLLADATASGDGTSALAPAQEEMTAQPPAADGDDVAARNQSEADRRRLRERIAGVSVEERSALAIAEAEALEVAASAPSAAASAEGAVAAAGSPGAALLAAVSRGASAVEVRALLLRGARPDAAFLDCAALSVAARQCSPGVVRVLIEAGADLETKDGRGWTPLMHAIDAHTVSRCTDVGGPGAPRYPPRPPFSSP